MSITQAVVIQDYSVQGVAISGNDKSGIAAALAAVTAADITILAIGIDQTQVHMVNIT